MALSQDDRISISKKLIDIPRENETADQIKDILEDSKQDAQKKDDANKNLQDSKTALVNPYQKEYNSYDGNERNELLEQDVLDAAEKKFQNFFFPNDPQTPLPSIPDGVWKNFPAFGLSKAIGKTYVETYPTTTREQDKIDAVNAAIALVEVLIDGTRSSGQECAEDTSGSCAGETPPGSGVDEATCLANGGVWTPSGGPDVYTPSQDAIDALDALQVALDDWKAFVTLTRGFNTDQNAVDTDAGRVAQNNISIADIDNLISIIDTWDALQDFDTTTSLPSGSGGAGCAAFAAMVPGDFDPSKLRSPELDLIKDEITARETYITTRTGEVDTNLGVVDQNTADGSLNSATGFYGDRYKIIDLRLNLMAGTLNALIAADKGQQAQDELKASNANAEDVYSSVLKVSAFRAPASGGPDVHVLDASEFNPGDNVFVMANTQQEISTSIISKDGNRLTLANDIPKKYRENDGARVYKDIS